MTVQAAVNLLWFVWYVTWIAAVGWSSKTSRQMKTDMGGLHRLLSGVGAVLLFIPSGSGSPVAHVQFLQLFFERLWQAPLWVCYSDVRWPPEYNID